MMLGSSQSSVLDHGLKAYCRVTQQTASNFLIVQDAFVSDPCLGPSAWIKV